MIVYRLTSKRHLWPLVDRITKTGREATKDAIALQFRERLKSADKESAEDLARDFDEEFQQGHKDFRVLVTFQEWRGNVYLIGYAGKDVPKVLDFLESEASLLKIPLFERRKPTTMSANTWLKLGELRDALRHPEEAVLTLRICDWDLYPIFDPLYHPLIRKRLQREVRPRKTMASLIKSQQTGGT